MNILSDPRQPATATYSEILASEQREQALTDAYAEGRADEREAIEAARRASFNVYRVTVHTPDGVSFKCLYGPDELGIAMEAVKNTAMRMTGTATIITFETTLDDPPPPPMSMEQWIAAGGSTD